MSILIGAVALAALILAAAALFSRRAVVLGRIVLSGKPNDRPADVPQRARNEVEIVLGQRKLFKRLAPGLMHAFIFWGFLVLLPTIVMAMIAAVDRHGELWWLSHQTWFGWLVDVFVILVLLGVVFGFINRSIVKPERFKGSHAGDAYFILAMIVGVVLTLLCWHASAYELGLNAHAGFLSQAIAPIFPAHSIVAERIFVWAHLCFVFGFLSYLPYSKHLHIITAAGNVWLTQTRAPGRLEPLRFDVPDEEMRFGVATILDLTQKELMDGLTCTECGRCQDVCPAYNTGKILSPKLLIMGVRDQVYAQDEGPILGNGVPEQSVWDCVTCGACVEVCPVSIEHVDLVVDLRRSSVMIDSKFPTEAEPMLRDLERAGNPWGSPQSDRAAWAEGLDVRVLEPGDEPPEYLYWVGCAAAFDERARTSAQSTAKLLKKAGVDFAILGPREACNGDPARRMGNEYVFQQYAEQNIATLNESKVTKIVASCPHCFNTLANEYGDFGGHYEVLHHTELLAELVRDGRLKPKAGSTPITYHDSCYLARQNDVISAPREIVSAVGEAHEMEQSGKKTFCCGAGGSHMWMEENHSPINEERVRQADETGATTLAVACPFCTMMLGDGVQSAGSDLRVVDLSTLLVESIED